VLVFDCIAFSKSLRWIDVMNDIAFLVMDLQAHGRHDLACCFLNQWLIQTGDFAGLRALRLYIVYRALVRALIETLKAGGGSTERARRYLDCALEAARPARPELMLCHGFSGSGKSAASAALARFIGAIRLSSDTERKRQGPLQPASETKLPRIAYAPSSIDASYMTLRRLTHAVLQAGYSVIVDATFLKARHRRMFFELADAAVVPVHILDFHASAESLAARIEARARVPHTLTDADLSVLVRQLANEDPLRREERALTLSFDTDVPLAAFGERDYWKPLLALAVPGRDGAAADPNAEALAQDAGRKFDLDQSACAPTG
jgi:predicted kinase